MYLAVKDIQNLAKSFSVYNVEMLVRKEELLQFAQTAITGLKVTGDIARIDFEISQIQQRLNGMKSQQSSIEGSEISSEATSSSTSSMDIEEPVTHIQLCYRLKSLLLKKQMLRKGDTIETHTQKVDILKVLIESLHNSASKTQKRILEHREEKKEALTFRVARTDEISQIEKELGAEISVLEKQRDKLEAELREVNNTLTAANTRLQNAREERFQFDEDNNEFLRLFYVVSHKGAHEMGSAGGRKGEAKKRLGFVITLKSQGEEGKGADRFEAARFHLDGDTAHPKS
ncbi:hypothetical protein LXL04_000476 [Taraxacum kok-saghyz]